MFNIQKCIDSHEIYINYNEYIKDGGDESLLILEHMIEDDNIKEFNGIIDLVTLKGLSNKDIKIIKHIYDILRNGHIENLNVISDNRKVLKRVKKIMPDASIKLLRLY